MEPETSGEPFRVCLRRFQHRVRSALLLSDRKASVQGATGLGLHRCDRNINLGVSMRNLAKMLKCAGWSAL